MKILWLKTELLHPLDRGGRIRTYNMLREIARQHEVTYLSLDDGTAAADARERAHEYCAEVITVPFRTAARNSAHFFAELAGNLLSPLPYAISKYKVGAFSRAYEDAMRSRRPDLVVCDFLMPAVNVHERPSVPSVIFQHNVESRIWERHAAVARNAISKWYFTKQWERMCAFEAAACRRFDHVIAVSPDDERMFRDEFGISSVSHVPTGVDVDYFDVREEPRDTNEIVFTGAMDWMPNIDGVQWFVDEILPLIRSRRPSVRFTVVGRSPVASILALKSIEGVTVTGTVPDIRDYLARAGAVVVPLRIGGGTRLKIFEAMSMAAPVVSTTVGAEGLPVEDETHMLRRDDPQSFADATLRLLEQQDAAARLGAVAAAYVRESYSWKSIAEEFIRQCAVSTGIADTAVVKRGRSLVAG